MKRQRSHSHDEYVWERKRDNKQVNKQVLKLDFKKYYEGSKQEYIMERVTKGYNIWAGSWE